MKHPEEPKVGAGHSPASYWNVGGNYDRSLRQARARATGVATGDKLAAHSDMPQRPTLSVGAPDASFIKALGAMCSDILRKLEDDCLPPAAVYHDWPPKTDTNFEHVQFEPSTPYGSFAPSSYPEIGQDVRQPVPLQRIVLPAISHMGTVAWPPVLPTSSSPLSSDDNPLKFHGDLMTPPETPVYDQAKVPSLPPPHMTVISATAQDIP